MRRSNTACHLRGILDPLLLSGVLWCALVGLSFAQSSFTLSAPGLNRSSHATMNERELRITDHLGNETIYVRTPQMDSNDRLFYAYRNAQTRQVIRWPVSNAGPMQIGNETAAGIEYRASQMQVIPRGGLGAAAVDKPVLPPTTRPLPPTRNPINPSLPNPLPTNQSLPSDVPLPGFTQPAAGSGLFSQILSQSRRTMMAGPTGLIQSSVPSSTRLQPQVLQLSVRDDRGREWYLGKAGPDRVMMHSVAEPTAANWTIVPAGQGYVRVQQESLNGWIALAVSNRRTLMIEPLAQDAGQLWRVAQANNYGQVNNYGQLNNPGDGYWLESAVAPGFVLSGAVSGAVNLQPITGGYDQIWYPVVPVLPPSYEPVWRTVDHQVQPNPPLPPAQIDIVNSHSGALRILIGDRRSPNVKQIRLAPGTKTMLTFDRDAGSTVIDTYEIRGTGGVWDRQQYVTQIPAAPIYDLSVYEEFLQSIAIDRTGTSPNVIEDVNYQPKSVGLLALPAGGALPERGQIDAFADATAARNPGAVRRFDPRTFEKPSSQPDPLEKILKDAAPPPRQKF